jgi:hypothetical protein
MASYEFEPPKDPRELELYLQHAAGLIIFEDMRRYAVEKIDPGLDQGSRNAALKAIDDAVYGLMMVFDGVSGTLKSDTDSVTLQTKVQLKRDGKTVSEVDLFEGEGMCMGFHGWREGDFGSVQVARSRSEGT